MKPLLRIFLFLLLAAWLPAREVLEAVKNNVPATANALVDPEQTISLAKVSGHVFVCSVEYVDLEGSHADHFPVIVANDGLIVVDTCMYPSIAAKVKAKIVKDLGRSDFLYLINTHHHWDHTCGNQTFSETTIIGHEFTPIDMKKFTGDNFRGFMDYRKDYYTKKGDALTLKLLAGLERDFVATPPTRTFADKEIMRLKGLTLVLYHVGRDGAAPSLYDHTRSDIFIYIPEDRVLCAGDVSFRKEWLGSMSADRAGGLFNGFLEFCRERGYGIEQVIFGHARAISR
jgi:glyoxylase-like metal-dependent hydrolase (beta-lactamase superfamily II)